MDILLLQIHLINQDYLEMITKDSPDSDNNNNNDNENRNYERIQAELKERHYGLNDELLKEILSFLSSQPLQGMLYSIITLFKSINRQYSRVDD